MSQSLADELGVSTEESTDENSETQRLAPMLEKEVEFATGLIASLTAEDLADMSDEGLVNLRSAIKDLENTVEDVRKDRVDGELETRVEPGEKLLGLHRVESHKKYVDESVGTVIMRAVGQGVDYTQFVELDASTLAEDFPDLAEIGRFEYDYFR